MAKRTAKKSMIEQKADQLKSVISSINNEALQVSDNLVDASIASGAKWQKIMAKALNNGTVLFGKQQDLLIETLTGVKGHYISGSKRVKKLLNFEMPKASKAEKTVKKVKAVSKAANAKSDTKKDNLKLIDGVGPKIATLLNEAGINTFEKLATTNMNDLQAILDAAGPRFKSQDPSTWRVQARKLIKK